MHYGHPLEEATLTCFPWLSLYLEGKDSYGMGTQAAAAARWPVDLVSVVWMEMEGAHMRGSEWVKLDCTHPLAPCVCHALICTRPLLAASPLRWEIAGDMGGRRSHFLTLSPPSLTVWAAADCQPIELAANRSPTLQTTDSFLGFFNQDQVHPVWAQGMGSRSTFHVGSGTFRTSLQVLKRL